MSPMADAVLTDGFGALQPGEMISIVLLDLGDEPISGQVLAADHDAITIFEPPADPLQSGYFEEIPADRIASITRHGSAPLTMTIADAFKGDAEPKGKTEARLERAAGLILLGLAVLAFVGAVSSLINAISRRAEEGEAELVALGQLGAVLFGIVGLLFLIAAVGVLRGTTWGGRLGLVVSGLIGALGSVAVLGSPMPWDHSANLGIYEATTVEWLLTLVPVVACWIVVVALIRKRSVPEGA